MPRFAANLGYLFSDRPLIERFGAAKAAGFTAVELQFPYADAATAVRREIDRHGLTMLGINTPLGSETEMGLAGVPGRERDFVQAFGQALDYAVTIGATAIHCMAGIVPPKPLKRQRELVRVGIALFPGLPGAAGCFSAVPPISFDRTPTRQPG